MSQDNNIANSTKNKHFTARERYKIEILLKEKLKAHEIGQRIGKSTRTIEREIIKGKIMLLNSDLTYRTEYCADAGQRIYEENSKNKGPGLKIGKDHKLVKYIENKIINEKFSPDAVIGRLGTANSPFVTSICTKTLYNYIDRGDVFLNLTNDDLPVKREGKKRDYKKVTIAHKNLKGTSIEERPADIEDREVYGHWEMDCVVGSTKKKDSGAALLVLSERKCRTEIIVKMPSKTQESVVAALNDLELKYGKRFKSIFKTVTVDNGCEFLNYKGMESSVKNTIEKRFKIYYAHPYSSWERGTNENTNKLIRRFIPKGVDIGSISKKRIKFIEEWINNYPRRIFGYKTANEMLLLAS
ncbi:MAG: IS30 family transposase [bacterium]|nr:IS30 family transposase [bacterium]